MKEQITDDDAYCQIVDLVDWQKPHEHVDALRELVTRNHADAMNLLAILLGDIDSIGYMNEIKSLYEKSHALGSVTAAKGMAIQYKQWDEPFLSEIWERRSRERGVD
jgi:hypothetical protein